MLPLKKYLLVVLLFVSAIGVRADEPISYLWLLDNLTEIDGIPVAVLGDPEVVDTDLGKAIKFDGDGDRILVDANPIESSKTYTVEVIFNADAGTLNQNNEPRFIHIQNPDDPRKKRVMMEIRVNENDKVYMDGFMLTDNSNLALIDETKLHNTKEWNHAAITYEGNTFTTYFNGVEELSGEVSYDSEIIDDIGQTSIGARMDKRNWYSGLIKCLKVTQAKLTPEQFMKVEDFKSTATEQSDYNEVQFFPMPAKNYLTAYNLKSYNKLELYDLSGVVVTEQNILTNQLTLNCSDIHSGIYLLRLIGPKKEVIKKVSIIH